eukprot:1342798-Rhodomonas_salina.1
MTGSGQSLQASLSFHAEYTFQSSVYQSWDTRGSESEREDESDRERDQVTETAAETETETESEDRD